MAAQRKDVRFQRFAPSNCEMSGYHDPLLTVLSMVLAVGASYTALELARRVALTAGRARAAWLVGGAMAMGIGIWSMHFTAMLAYRLPVPIHYEIPLWVLSIVIAIGVSLFALYIVGREHVGRSAALTAGVLMGVAITGMHYTGMAAVWVPGRITHDLRFVTASIAIAVVAAIVALRLLLLFRRASGPRARWGKVASALVMGAAIVGLHYTAMGGVRFLPGAEPAVLPGVPLLSRAGLAPAVVGGSAAILMIALLAVVVDHRITQTRAERELHRQRAAMLEASQRLAAIVESSDDAIISQALDGTILSWNPGAERIFGYTPDEMIGGSAARLIPPERAAEDADILARVAAGEHIDHYETLRTRKDGRDIHISVTASPVVSADGQTTSAAVTVRDITERNLMEQRLRQAHRLEAVGRFAGGIAHDFNNLLTVIRGHLDLIPAGVRDQPDLRDELREISRAAERATLLTLQLLAFSRKQVMQTDVFDLNAMLLEMNPMFRRLIGTNVEVVTILAPDGGHIRADRSQIEQVVMNLVVNARDAMPQGGVLTIRTETVTSSDTDAQSLPSPITAGSYIVLSVEDTGEGMSEATRAQVFEPFFTTKERGKGTGLGLSTVYGIVKQSGGHVTVFSEPGAGSRFTIHLPLVTEAVSRQEPVATTPTVHADGTVLVVEDEPAVHDLVVRILRRGGFSVLQAVNGEEALRIAADNPAFDIVLTDVVMPIMGGPELVQRLRETRPDLPIVYMSGFIEEAPLRADQFTGITYFLQKPFSPPVLLDHVSRALHAARRGSPPYEVDP